MTDDDPTFDMTGALPFDGDADASTPQKPGTAVLSARDFAYIGRGLTPGEFRMYVRGYQFGTTPPDYIVLHHTAIPSASWARYPSGAVWDANEAGMSDQAIYAKRLRQLGQLRNYYRDALGWAFGPHLFIDERWIWLFTPMYDVGIHAAQGNSYRDSGGHLHYSVGIEVIGYYEKVHWPPQVAANVRGAVQALKNTLKTFQLVDKKWAGGISAHRHYGKPACPGAAIVPSYYLPVLKGIGEGERPEHPGLVHYRVLPAVTGGATMRTGPAQGAAIMGRLKAGDDFWGEPVEGQRWYIEGFGHGSIWIRSDDQRHVWANLLEEVKQS